MGRGQVGEVLADLSKESEESGGGSDSDESYRLVVAPYLSTFNDSLKEERNQVSRIYGEAMHEVHAV